MFWELSVVVFAGPYTLFAPTEAALQELLDRLGGVDALLQQMGKQNVVKVGQRLRAPDSSCFVYV